MHAITIVTNKVKRVHMFMRELTFSIRSYVVRAARDGASFQSIVSTAKEADSMVREEFGDPNRAYSSGWVFGSSS
ncbi:hypothetical protein H5410_030333 [Solanum commersonii]|uniref:Uncharacterized protein n=1 Tax=Solanum commersonii TaxID=4109 RepID=A0A9J5YE13_SOLCO|nr:hypothetical protein H5410_030333 [Solanum commersonii]